MIVSNGCDVITEVTIDPEAIIIDYSKIPDELFQAIRHEFGYDLLDGGQ